LNGLRLSNAKEQRQKIKLVYQYSQNYTLFIEIAKHCHPNIAKLAAAAIHCTRIPVSSQTTSFSPHYHHMSNAKESVETNPFPNGIPNNGEEKKVHKVCVFNRPTPA